MMPGTACGRNATASSKNLPRAFERTTIHEIARLTSSTRVETEIIRTAVSQRPSSRCGDETVTRRPFVRVNLRVEIGAAGENPIGETDHGGHFESREADGENVNSGGENAGKDQRQGDPDKRADESDSLGRGGPFQLGIC